MNDHTPLIVIELILVFGGVLLFAWWQLRDLKKEREKRQGTAATALTQSQLNSELITTEPAPAELKIKSGNE